MALHDEAVSSFLAEKIEEGVAMEILEIDVGWKRGARGVFYESGGEQQWPERYIRAEASCDCTDEGQFAAC